MPFLFLCFATAKIAVCGKIGTQVECKPEQACAGGQRGAARPAGRCAHAERGVAGAAAAGVLQQVVAAAVDAHDLAEVENAIQPNTKAVYLETLGNPNSDIPDIDAIAAIAHKHGLRSEEHTSELQSPS